MSKKDLITMFVGIIVGLIIVSLFGGCAGSNSRRAPTVSEVRHQEAVKLQTCERAAFRSVPEPQMKEEDDSREDVLGRDEKRRESVRECLLYGDMSEHGYVMDRKKN